MSNAPRSLLALALLFAAACGAGEPGVPGPPSPPGARTPRVAVVPKGTTHVFWKSVEAGARQAGADLGLEIVWKGPLQENDRAQQIQLVQQLATQELAGLCLAPLDHAALVPAVRAARARGLPVVIFDSALDGQAGLDFESFVATDNAAGGRLAGEELLRRTGAGAELVVLRYLVGSASTHEREEGCLAAVRAGGARVLVDNRHAGATAGEAKDTALNLAAELRRAQGVFASNESATQGLLLALRQLGLAGKLRFVGFDASPPLIAALEAGEIDALVVQNPRRMGYLAVDAVARRLKGERLPAYTDTGAVLVTRDNLHQPAIQQLLE